MDLKPCPFCGGKEFIFDEDCFRAIGLICSCGASSSRSRIDGEVEKEWNTRPIEDALRAEIAALKQQNENLRCELTIAREHIEALEGL